MPLSSELQQRLDHIRVTQAGYQPNAEVRQALATKSLIAIVGPCAVGKSYVIDTLTGVDDEFAKVRSITTRAPRPDDTPETMQCFPWTEEGIGDLCTHVEAGDAVNYVIHPTTGDLYGTLADSYPATYNLLPALSNSIASLEQLPFHRVFTIGIVATPDDWDRWFSHRDFASPTDRNKRITEAALSLEWLLASPQAAIIRNHAGDPLYATNAIQAVVRDDDCHRNVSVAESLLEHIKGLDK